MKSYIRKYDVYSTVWITALCEVFTMLVVRHVLKDLMCN